MKRKCSFLVSLQTAQCNTDKSKKGKVENPTLLKIMYVTEFIGFGLGSRLDFEKFDIKN